jgi:outer membrane immunogenic protein
MRNAVLTCLTLSSALAISPAAAQGLRADIHAGLDSLHSDGESQRGASYGLTLSYDLASERLVAGFQLDLDATDNRDCENDVLVAGDRACIEGKRDNAVGVRLGSRLGGSTMIVGMLGYANSRFEAHYRGAGVNTSEHETLNGIRIGASLVTDIGRKLYAKADYRYTNYEQGVSRHQGLLGVGLRF